MKFRVSPYPPNAEIYEIITAKDEDYLKDPEACPSCWASTLLEENLSFELLCRTASIVFIEQECIEGRDKVSPELWHCIRRIEWSPSGMKRCSLVTRELADIEIQALSKHEKSLLN